MIKLNFDIKKHKLKNGLEVVTIKKDTQIASVNIGIKIGAMFEKENEKGISHFVEHMLFKGTKSRSNEKLNDELESLGGEYNAYTDYDSTVYTINCLEEEIENGIYLLGDMIKNSNFPKKEIEKERGVILAEIRTGKDDIEDLSFKRTNELAFNKCYMKCDVIGREENVNNFTRDDIYKYYSDNYRPNNSVIVTVTSFEHDKALTIIEKAFENWESKEIEKIDIIKEENIKNRKITYKEDIEQNTIVYLYTFNELSKEEELPLRILNHRLGESANSLLFREIRENKGYAYDVFTHLDITKNLKSLYIYTAVSEEDVFNAEESVNEVIEKIVKNKITFTEKDLDIMKKVHKTAVVSTIEDSGDLCNYVIHQVLEGESEVEFAYDMERLNNLKIEDVYKVSKKVLKNPTVHILRKKGSNDEEDN